MSDGYLEGIEYWGIGVDVWMWDLSVGEWVVEDM